MQSNMPLVFKGINVPRSLKSCGTKALATMGIRKGPQLIRGNEALKMLSEERHLNTQNRETKQPSFLGTNVCVCIRV